MHRLSKSVFSSVAVGAVGQAALAGGFAWQTIANNGQAMPGSSSLFNSYNQPSINSDGLVVFRARSKGPQQPVRGVYAVHAGGGPISVVAEVSDEVPQPNNTPGIGGEGLATFREFPSFPRIDSTSAMIATRAQSQPTWTYMLPDGTETRVGTAGVYATVGGVLRTGASLLGAVADAGTGALVFPWWQVPGTAPGTRFDQFPGAASPCDGEFIVFKGNWTDVAAATGRTGVYFRSMTAMGGNAPVTRIADSTMLIPDQPKGGSVPFGSTAPPSAAFGTAVFLGLDSEEAPTMGGIYLAALEADPELRPVVRIGDPVPGADPGSTFVRIGEALSFDGRWVAFWGAWGTRMTPRVLTCPVDGNADLIAFCNEEYPDGFLVEVPEHQGFFAADVSSGAIHAIAVTGDGIDDMMYWNFSGSPPGSGEGDEGGDQELPRWRSASFVAIAGTGPGTFQAAFKARSGSTDAIFLRNGPYGAVAAPIVGTSTNGSAVDAQAPAGSSVTAVGIERDALRGGRLAMTASMLDVVSGESWAGVYVTDVPGPHGCAGDLNGDGSVGGADLGLLLTEWGCPASCIADIDGDGAVGGSDLGLMMTAWGPCR